VAVVQVLRQLPTVASKPLNVVHEALNNMILERGSACVDDIVQLFPQFCDQTQMHDSHEFLSLLLHEIDDVTGANLSMNLRQMFDCSICKQQDEKTEIFNMITVNCQLPTYLNSFLVSNSVS
jgi:hypothetical protein